MIFVSNQELATNMGGGGAGRGVKVVGTCVLLRVSGYQIKRSLKYAKTMANFQLLICPISQAASLT